MALKRATYTRPSGQGPIIKILDKEGIKVISSIFFNPELAVNVGTYTKLKPSTEDNKSIKKGIKYFTGLNELDHVQAIIVKDSKILAVEGRQGKKVMLSKIKKKTDGILIKLPKKKTRSTNGSTYNWFKNFKRL